ncbi:ArsI/CadI family heavy metal resistance metalloenzyme [Fulvivirga lutimaris]|uniref:ArsI/CadI family heavy metal resistance metalloenzyme n=1 Tax=Fulvivirga lutimaris TaxID=1819566 RepID=UPI0012BBD00D|nr:ArsI/CadI family heavy metal resistance metalloenzyme [Fulvivirga lutimaris]MTI40795.1 hypothetical protein [Fulvivirga lutimaris]
MENFTTRMHVSYSVSNIEKTVAFYNKFFETEPVKTKKGYAKYLLDEPSLNISFVQSEKVNPQHVHFGIEVNNPELLKSKLGNALTQDLPIDEEKEVKCCYAKQDKFWVTDPDGYKWEVFKFLEDVEQNDEKYAEEGACCS